MIKVIYEASSGRRYDLKAEPVRIKNANFHNYAWTREVINQRFGETVQRFAKDAQEYETTLYLMGSQSEIKQTLYDLHNDFERDITSQTPGRLWWHNSYIPCYITASSTYPHENNYWVCNEITIYCPSPFWIVNIGGNIYNVNVSVPSGGYLVIDSRQDAPLGWQVYLRNASGQASNVFDSRNPNYQILERIPGGTVGLTYPRTYGIDLTLYLERSEPSWMN